MRLFVLVVALLIPLLFSVSFASSLTSSKFYADYGTQFAGGETVRILVKVVGEPVEENPADRAKEIRYYQAGVLKFIHFAGAINVVSDQYDNQFTATMTKLAEHISQRSDVISVTLLHNGQLSSSGDILPPKKQMSQGVDSKEIMCKPGKTLIIKNTDNSPACVSSASMEKLVARGWGIPG